MAEPTPIQAAAIRVGLDEEAMNDAIQKLDAKTKEMFSRIPENQREALQKQLAELEGNLRKQEQDIRANAERWKQIIADKHRAGKISDDEYMRHFKQVMDQQRTELDSLERQHRQAFTSMAQTTKSTLGELSAGLRQVGGEAWTGLGFAGAVAGVTGLAGFFMMLRDAFSQQITFQRQIGSLTAAAGGRIDAGATFGTFGGDPGAGYRMQELGREFMAAGVSEQDVFGIARQFAGQRRPGGQSVLAQGGLVEQALQLGTGSGLGPQGVAGVFARLLDTGVAATSLRDIFLQMASTAKDLNLNLGDHVKNVMVLNDSLRPFGFSVRDSNRIVANWSEELRRGTINVQQIGQLMGGAAQAPLGSLAFMGSQMFSRPDLMGLLPDAAQKAIQGAAGSAFDLSAVMRGVAQGRFGEAGATGAFQVFREFSSGQAQQMGLRTEAGQTEMFRLLMMGLGFQGVAGLTQQDLRKFMDDPMKHQEMLKTPQEQMGQDLANISKFIQSQKTTLDNIAELVKDFIMLVAAGFDALVHPLSGAAQGAFNVQFDAFARHLGLEQKKEGAFVGGLTRDDYRGLAQSEMQRRSGMLPALPEHLQTIRSAEAAAQFRALHGPGVEPIGMRRSPKGEMTIVLQYEDGQIAAVLEAVSQDLVLHQAMSESKGARTLGGRGRFAPSAMVE